jgi:hypothetical protein
MTTTKFHVDSEGTAVLTITQRGDDGFTYSKTEVGMTLTDASALAEQITEAVAGFPGSPVDSPAWFEAHR